MRSIIGAPRRKFPDLAQAEYSGAIHLKFEDAAGSTITDFYGFSNLTASTTTIITAPFYEQTAAALGKGRDFTVAGSSTGNGTPTAGQRAILDGAEWTWEWVGSIDSLAGDLVTLFGHGSASATANSIFNVGLAVLGRSDGRIMLYFETGVRSGTTLHSDVGALRTGEILHVAVRKYKNSLASNYYYDFFVNGRWCGRAISSASSTAGSSGLWRLGTGLTPTSTGFSGEIYEARIVGVAMSAAYIRNNAHRVLKRFDYEAMFAGMTYNAHARVLLENTADGTCALFNDDVGLIDLDAYDTTAAANFNVQHRVLESVKVKDDADSPGATATFTCAREVYAWRYSPFYATASAVSAPTGQPLFDLARRVMVEVALVPMGVQRSDVEPHEWIRIFDGHISSVDFGDQTMEVQCRDRLAPLQWTFIKPLAPNYKEPIYGNDTTGDPIETVIKSIITDATPAVGMIGGPPDLYTPTSPGWALRRRSVAHQPLADAIAEKVDQIGWVCRYLWDDKRHQHRLTLFNPDRAAASVRTWATNSYLNMKSASLNEDTIRNICEVVFTNRQATVATTFTANAATDVITHTGLDVPNLSQVRVSTSGTLPAPLAALTDYWTVRQSSSTSKLATSLANAQANTTIDLTTAGTGTHTLTLQQNAQNLGDWPRARVSVSDSTSIAKYGERYCQISEEAASQIDTTVEATTLATAVVSDLAQPKAICSAEHLCFPFVELGDNYTYNTADHFSGAEQFAVTSWEHSFDAAGNHATTLGLRGKAVAHVDGWLENIVGPGLAPHAPFLETLAPIEVITTPFDGGIHVKFPFPVNNLVRNFDMAEVHMTTDVGAWTPSAATLKGVTRSDSLFVPLSTGPNTDVQTKIIMRDRSKNVTAAVAGTTRKPRASLNDSPVGEARRDDGSGTQVALANATPLYFPGLFHNPYGAFVQGVGPGGTLFVAPWTGRYTFNVACRFARNASSPLRSNSYRLYAVDSPKTGTSGTGSGGTLIATNANSGWILPGLAGGPIADLESMNWTFSLQLTASTVVALQINYGLDPGTYSRCFFDFPEAASTAAQHASWKAYFNGAGN